MPRNYIRKTDKAAYSKEKLKDAIRAVKNGSMSAYTASKHYNIPRSTIVNRIYERRGLKSDTLGRSTILSREVEESLVKNLHIMEKYGFGLTRKEILEVVGEYVNENCIVSPFKDGAPGEDWFLGLKKRHGLSVKKPQPVEYARKNACRPDIIYPYFDLLENTINELDLHDKPSHIYNLDETSFSKDPSKSKVVGLKGFTSTRTISSPGKDNTTVLLGCNAIGDKIPPLIIYKGKNVWDEWTSPEAYPGTIYAATVNGWMESQVFETFFDKVFLPTVGQHRPILLIYDGHSTHVGIIIIEKARAAGITILKIPPHTSDVLQPLDLSVNKSFKDKWDVALVKWQRRHVGKVLPKKEFSKMIGEVWTAVERNVCSAGFRKAGIYPLNKNAVPPEKFNQILLQAWKTDSTRPEGPGEVVDSALSRELYRADTASNKTYPICHNDDDVKLVFQQRNKLCELKEKQPELLQKMVLASINNVISGSHAGVLAQSYNVHSEENRSVENKPLTSGLLNESSVGINELHVSIQNCVPVSKYHDISLKNQPKTAPKFSLDATCSDTRNSKVKILDDRPVLFEELLLKSVKGGITVKAKRRKVATGAELITNDDVYTRCKIIEAEKEQKLREKERKAMEKEEKNKAKELLKKSKQDKNKGTNIMKTTKDQQPGPSGLCTTIQDVFEKTQKTTKQKKGGINQSQQLQDRQKQKKVSNMKDAENCTTNYKINHEELFSGGLLNTIQNVKRKRNLEYDGSTTSVSDIMSVHSDSSIFDVQDYEDHIDSGPPTPGGCPTNMSEASVGFVSHSSDNLRLNPPPSRDAVVIETNDSNDTSCSTEEDVAPLSNIAQITSTYCVDDNVLVRYYIKKAWKYYIGVVTACNDNRSYDISFYTTTHNKGELKFKVPKKKDRDTVPEGSMVKVMEIFKGADKPEVYTLRYEDDKIYFDFS